MRLAPQDLRAHGPQSSTPALAGHQQSGILSLVHVGEAIGRCCPNSTPTAGEILLAAALTLGAGSSCAATMELRRKLVERRSTAAVSTCFASAAPSATTDTAAKTAGAA
eukprot:CAMPEP_0172914436 /NCGR_PEP_ID=MMETSP1075-20121228/192411_1 /TAXON_ID=2916 /ORGANISM="Ceratium fusus, Strain PA161109" /LENGTH=108 /DNA_ID=CAMNT_0013773355 /DNA_START=358 /DNA_END=684 /DNA_ORIENTATION=-